MFTWHLLNFLSGHRFHCHPGGTNLKIPSRSIKDIYIWLKKNRSHNQTLNLTGTSHTKQETNSGKKQEFYFLTKEHRKLHLSANNLYFLKALILQKKFFCGGRASKRLTCVKKKTNYKVFKINFPLLVSVIVLITLAYSFVVDAAFIKEFYTRYRLI